jgi:hypothetical protein
MFYEETNKKFLLAYIKLFLIRTLRGYFDDRNATVTASEEVTLTFPKDSGSIFKLSDNSQRQA